MTLTQRTPKHGPISSVLLVTSTLLEALLILPTKVSRFFPSPLGSHLLFGAQLLQVVAHFSGRDDNADADEDIVRILSFIALY
jgi:hypothetical protein